MCYCEGPDEKKNPKQDVEHVLLHCPLLKEKREPQLTRHPDVNCDHLKTLLTKHASHTTKWAILNLQLEQFQSVKCDYDILFR